MVLGMDFYSYAAVALVALAGLPVGIFLSLFAFEELKSGNRYFSLLSKILFVAVSSVPIVAGEYPAALRGVSYGAIILAALLVSDSRVSYVFLSLAFSLSSKTNYFALTASLVFLYGLSSGALIAGTSGHISLKNNLLRVMAQETVKSSGLLIAFLLYFML